MRNLSTAPKCQPDFEEVGAFGGAHRDTELGGYFSVDGAVAAWLRLRVWSLLRLPYSEQNETPPNRAVSFVFGASATGNF